MRNGLHRHARTVSEHLERGAKNLYGGILALVAEADEEILMFLKDLFPSLWR